VDIAVNGTYWAGAILGTLGSLLLLHVLPLSLGWRLGFLLGWRSRRRSHYRARRDDRRRDRGVPIR
jgi:hypothetical protein